MLASNVSQNHCSGFTLGRALHATMISNNGSLGLLRASNRFAETRPPNVETLSPLILFHTHARSGSGTHTQAKTTSKLITGYIYIQKTCSILQYILLYSNSVFSENQASRNGKSVIIGNQNESEFF